MTDPYKEALRAILWIAEQEAKNLVDEYKKYGFQYSGNASKAVEKFAKAAIKRSKAVNVAK